MSAVRNLGITFGDKCTSSAIRCNLNTSGDDISRYLRLPFISKTHDIRDVQGDYGDNHTDKVKYTFSLMDVIYIKIYDYFDNSITYCEVLVYYSDVFTLLSLRWLFISHTGVVFCALKLEQHNTTQDSEKFII